MREKYSRTGLHVLNLQIGLPPVDYSIWGHLGKRLASVIAAKGEHIEEHFDPSFRYCRSTRYSNFEFSVAYVGNEMKRSTFYAPPSNKYIQYINMITDVIQTKTQKPGNQNPYA